jgi:hypothetical protein
VNALVELRALGQLGQHIPDAVAGTTLAIAVRPELLDRPDQPWRPVRQTGWWGRSHDADEGLQPDQYVGDCVPDAAQGAEQALTGHGAAVLNRDGHDGTRLDLQLTARPEPRHRGVGNPRQQHPLLARVTGGAARQIVATLLLPTLRVTASMLTCPMWRRRCLSIVASSCSCHRPSAAWAPGSWGMLRWNGGNDSMRVTAAVGTPATFRAASLRYRTWSLKMGNSILVG